MFFKRQNKQKPARQYTLNKGKAKFAESLNNYNTLREAIEHQFRNREVNVAPKPRPKFQIT